MSQYDFHVACQLKKVDHPFYSLLMAAMMKADDENTLKFKMVWPEIWAELEARYHARGQKSGPSSKRVTMRAAESCPGKRRPMPDDTVNLYGEDIPVLILALLTLELIWKEHPDVVRAMASKRNQPGLIDLAIRAKSVREKLLILHG